MTLEEGTISVFLSLKGITESRDFFYQCAKEWNILDASFKEINSLLPLNSTLKAIYILDVFALRGIAPRRQNPEEVP